MSPSTRSPVSNPMFLHPPTQETTAKGEIFFLWWWVSKDDSESNVSDRYHWSEFKLQRLNLEERSFKFGYLGAYRKIWSNEALALKIPIWHITKFFLGFLLSYKIGYPGLTHILFSTFIKLPVEYRPALLGGWKQVRRRRNGLPGCWKTLDHCHSRESGSPEKLGKTGFLLEFTPYLIRGRNDNMEIGFEF